VDRTLEVRTPESIAFHYELAGLGSRFLAVAVDQAIQFVVLLAILGGILLALFRMAPHGPPPVAGKVAASLAAAVLVLIIFSVFFIYFILFEALWNGQTPGKKLVGIRVVRDGGYPIDFGASLIRNLIRVGEELIGYYLLSAISALISPENKRLGDLAAGTIVVRDSRLAAPSPFVRRTDEPVSAAAVHLDGEERALIKRFLERREALSEDRRRELAARLSTRVRNRLPLDLSRLDDESLLERL